MSPAETTPTTPRDQGEPRTEAGKAMLRRTGTLFSHDIIHAIEEQAATEARRELLAKVEGLTDAAREVQRFYGTDRTWSLAYRELLGSRIDDLAAACDRLIEESR